MCVQKGLAQGEAGWCLGGGGQRFIGTAKGGIEPLLAGGQAGQRIVN